MQVRTQCLATVTKVLHFSESGALGEELTDLPISSFIASLLSQKDSATVAKALQLAEILMHKLPALFSKHFLKEGVVHAIEQLAGSAPQAAGEEKEKARSKAAKRASQRLKVRMAYMSCTVALAFMLPKQRCGVLQMLLVLFVLNSVCTCCRSCTREVVAESFFALLVQLFLPGLDMRYLGFSSNTPWVLPK